MMARPICKHCTIATVQVLVPGSDLWHETQSWRCVTGKWYYNRPEVLYLGPAANCPVCGVWLPRDGGGEPMVECWNEKPMASDTLADRLLQGLAKGQARSEPMSAGWRSALESAIGMLESEIGNCDLRVVTDPTMRALLEPIPEGSRLVVLTEEQRQALSDNAASWLSNAAAWVAHIERLGENAIRMGFREDELVHLGRDLTLWRSIAAALAEPESAACEEAT